MATVHGPVAHGSVGCILMHAARCPGVHWLHERIASWDLGSRRRRKELLEEFLGYVKQSSLTGMEEIDTASSTFSLSLLWKAIADMAAMTSAKTFRVKCHQGCLCLILI